MTDGGLGMSSLGIFWSDYFEAEEFLFYELDLFLLEVLPLRCLMDEL